ncbi:MAG: chemotaxis protein CheV [Oligoflexus sp.]
MSFKKNSMPENDFDAGRNCFELIEFSLIRQLPSGETMVGRYGVNVAKVREVVHMPKINPLGSTVTGIAGLFELRGVPIPAVNLRQVLGDRNFPESPNQQIIVTEFSQKRAGFIVSSTNRIRRVAWEKVMPPSADISSCMTGMVLIENHEFLFILDLERILANLEGDHHSEELTQSNMLPHGWKSKPHHFTKAGVILLVDDSRLILHNVSRALIQEGYQVMVAHDGQEALERLAEVKAGRFPQFPKIDAIVTDIEMPRLNGISLVTRIREMQEYQNLPILLHTSLDGEASKDAARRAGANGYVVKNDIMNIIETLKQLLHQDLFSVAN